MRVTFLATSCLPHHRTYRLHCLNSLRTSKKAPIRMQKPDGKHASMPLRQSFPGCGLWGYLMRPRGSDEGTLFPGDIPGLAPPTAKQSHMLADGQNRYEQHQRLKLAQTLDAHLLRHLCRGGVVHLPLMLQPGSIPQRWSNQAYLPLPWKLLHCKSPAARMRLQVPLKDWAHPMPPGQQQAKESGATPDFPKSRGPPSRCSELQTPWPKKVLLHLSFDLPSRKEAFALPKSQVDTLWWHHTVPVRYHARHQGHWRRQRAGFPLAARKSMGFPSSSFAFGRLQLQNTVRQPPGRGCSLTRGRWQEGHHVRAISVCESVHVMRWNRLEGVPALVSALARRIWHPQPMPDVLGRAYLASNSFLRLCRCFGPPARRPCLLRFGSMPPGLRLQAVPFLHRLPVERPSVQGPCADSCRVCRHPCPRRRF
eukprot:scaffold840_cov344-Pavlova_lutheri.AAC.103